MFNRAFSLILTSIAIPALVLFLNVSLWGQASDRAGQNPLDRQRIQDMINQLASDSPYERDNAEKVLLDLAGAAVPDLAVSARCVDPEVRERSRRILSLIALESVLGRTLAVTFSSASSGIGKAEILAQYADRLRTKESPEEVLEYVARELLSGRETVPEKQRIVRRITENRLSLCSQVLIRLLDDSDPDVRLSAADALQELCVKQAGNHLIAMLGDPSAYVRSRIPGILLRCRQQVDASSIAKLLSSSRPELRASAAETLALFEAKEYSDEIASLIRDKESHVRRTAALALGRLDAKRWESSIALLLSDADWHVRRVALTVLAHLWATSFTREIVAMLGDEMPEVRKEAVDVIALWGKSEEGKCIVKAVRDPNPQVRMSAVWACQQLDLVDACVSIQAALASEKEPYVREQMISALRQFQPSRENVRLPKGN